MKAHRSLLDVAHIAKGEPHDRAVREWDSVWMPKLAAVDAVVAPAASIPLTVRRVPNNGRYVGQLYWIAYEIVTLAVTHLLDSFHRLLIDFEPLRLRGSAPAASHAARPAWPRHVTPSLACGGGAH